MGVLGEGVVEEEGLDIQGQCLDSNVLGQDHHADLAAPDPGLVPETPGADRIQGTGDKMEEYETKIHVFILSIIYIMFYFFKGGLCLTERRFEYCFF
nr:unnamed protein product [Callosobruchus chinensis]